MLRPLGRGVRDTLDNLLPFIVASLAWWLSAILIVTAPAGTLALYAYTDPRRQSDHLRPDRDELATMVRRDILRGWVLALAFAVPLLVLVANLRAYADTGGVAQWLIPLWTLLLLLFVSAGGIAASLRAVHDRPIGPAIRSAIIITLGRAHLLLPVVLILWVIVAIGGVLVVPAVMFIPPLVAATFNHLTYDALGITVDDPLEPTDERRGEDARSRGGKYSVG